MILRDYPPARNQRYSALGISTLVHLLLLLWFWSVPLNHFAIPAASQKNPQPFQVRRIEMNAGSLRTEPVPGPRFTANPATSPEPAPQFSSDGRVIEQALRAQEPNLTLPSPPQVAIAQSPAYAANAAAQSTPYTLSDQAKLNAEIAHFPTGPSSLGAPQVGSANATSEGGGQGPQDGPGGRAGLTGPAQAGGAGVPSFQDIQTELRPATPGLRTPEFEPLLLRLPSDIVFDFDSAQLGAHAEPLLNQAMVIIQKTPRAEIIVEGHTDTIGSEEYNLKLSQQRAETVATFFRKTLPAENYKVTSKGFGKSHPIVNPQGSIEEQKPNRRVEITIQSLAR